MRLLALIALALALATPAEARTNGQRAALYNGIGSPTTIDFRAGVYAPLTEGRTTSAWDYGPTGAIVSYAANVPRTQAWSQRVPIEPRGLAQFVGKQNSWLNNTQTQTRTIINGTGYMFWCDSANGTDFVTFTIGITGVATCNGWPGALTATAIGVSAIATVTGTVTHGQLTNNNVGAIAVPPIVTVGAAVTSNGDVSSFLPSMLAGWNSEHGTAVVRFIPTSFVANITVPISFSDGTSPNRILVLGAANTGVFTVQQVIATANAVTSSIGTGVLNTPNTIAFAWDGSRFWGSLNGRAPVGAFAPNSGFLPTLNRVGMGNNQVGVFQCNCYILSMRYLPVALPMQLNKLSQ